MSKAFPSFRAIVRDNAEQANSEYMVSYQLHNGKCGNITGTLADVKLYRDNNAGSWKSYSFFLCVPPVGFSITKDLLPVNDNGEPSAEFLRHIQRTPHTA